MTAFVILLPGNHRGQGSSFEAATRWDAPRQARLAGKLRVAEDPRRDMGCAIRDTGKSTATSRARSNELEEVSEQIPFSAWH